MVGTLGHEEFYRTGTWCDPSQGVYVGWSVQKEAFSDGMPLAGERGDPTLVFSGEEYPEPGTAQRLRDKGHTCAVEGADYLVHLAEDNPTFPAGLNGRFHGLLVDRAQGVVALFNDRYGMHRLYYHEARDGFYFAVEAKAILAVRPELRKLDQQALGEFISCGCVLGDRTLFEGVRLLPPGSRWLFRGGSLERREAYFSPDEWEGQAVLEPEAYYSELRAAFSRNLPRYFGGRQRIGMSLTGGLDTRMVMAWHKQPPGELPCYSFGGTRRECADVRVARSVARTCGQPYDVIAAGGGFLSRFPYYAERAVYLTDGCADVSRCPDLYMYERARQIGPVRMTGNYGGEVLRRVRAFKPKAPLAGLFAPELTPHVNAAVDTYNDISATHPLSFAVFRQGPWFYHGSLALEQSQLTSRTPYLDNDFVRTVFRAPASACVTNDVCLRLIEEGDPILSRLPTDRGLVRDGSIPAALRRQWLELEFKAEYAYDYGMPQWLAQLDRLAAPLRPERLFLGRHKFYHFRVWYRDILSSQVQDILLDPRSVSRPYLDASAVKRIVGAHVSGRGNYTSEIHRIMTLEFINRLFIDRPGSVPLPAG